MTRREFIAQTSLGAAAALAPDVRAAGAASAAAPAPTNALAPAPARWPIIAFSKPFVELGFMPQHLARIIGPAGNVQGARSATELAVGIYSEILETARAKNLVT